MELENKICKLVRENPRYAGILKRAIEVEEKKANDRYFLGWEWHDVRAWPAELMKLVREGIVDITYKSRRYTHYKLADRESVKRALRRCALE
ncbi:MAG: hypothetical protein ACTSXX_14585 [Candidatus Baldrarchaeia archaeon]